MKGEGRNDSRSEVGANMERSKGMERKIERLRERMEEREEGMIGLIGGDFNARTGEEGG